MKKFTNKKLLACMLAGMVAVGGAVGMSGCYNSVDLEGKLAIWVLDAGYGTAWVDEMVKAYNKIYPDVEVVPVKDNQIASKFDAKIRNPKTNDYDLIFSNSLTFNNYVNIQLKTGGKLYEDLLVNFTDELWGQKPVKADGSEENTTIKDKLRGEFLKVVTHENGDAYAYPYAGGASGIIYNETLFEQKGWKIPETSGELIELTHKIYNEEVVGKSEENKIYPWAWTGKCAVYWQNLTYGLYGSYVGIDNFHEFWNCRQYDGEEGYPGTVKNGDLSAPTPEVFANEGRAEMLEVMEAILNPYQDDKTISQEDHRYMYGYCIPKAQDMSVAKAQRMFMDGKAAMYVCGSWFEREMENWFKENPNNTVKLKVMKTPVLDGAKTLWDKALADGKVTQDEYNDAMNISISAGADLTCVIPVYSEEKQEALNFLRFMSSDDGAKIYAKYAKSILPLNYNWEDENWVADFNEFVKPGSFLQSQIDIDKVCAYGYDGQRINQRFYGANAVAFYSNGRFPEPIMSRLVFSERETATSLFNYYYNSVKNGWAN